MNSFLETGFELPKLLWQVVNFAVLLSIIGIVVFFPWWVIRKINSIEKNLKDINEKLDRKE